MAAKILVTGASGLLGHELCNQLKQSGNEVVAIDNNFRSQRTPNADCYIQSNVVDALKDLDTDFDYIYHYSAINGTKYFYSMANELLENNVGTDLALFQFAKQNKNLQKIVYASSSEVPSGHPHDIIDETTDITIDNIHNPRWCYRLAKICSENYLANSNLPWVAIRYFNIYGKYSLPGHFVYDIIEKIKNNNFELIGCNETRSYCYVDDAVDASIYLGNNVQGRVVNVGNDRELSTIDAANIIALKLGIININWVCAPSRPGSTQRRRPDISQLKELYPTYAPRSFEQGIQLVIE